MRTHRGRDGIGIAELIVALSIAAVVIGALVILLLQARHAETRRTAQSDLLQQALLAHVALSRDLARLHYVQGSVPLSVINAPAGERPAPSGVTMELIAGRDAPREQVSWRFDPVGGVLQRTSAGQRRLYPLGAGSIVVFRKVVPDFGRGKKAVIGEYGNRLLYRITARTTTPMGPGTVTLVGAAPFLVKASTETFPFWVRSSAPGVAPGAPL